MTTQVTIAGVAGTATIDIVDGNTVRDVLEEGMKTLGINNADLERLAPVVDGEDAELDDQVTPATAQVTAAPRVANG